MKKTGFKITFADGESGSATASILNPIIKEGFWLDENDGKLTQANGITADALFGTKVKVQIITEDAKDDKKIEVEIKVRVDNTDVKLTEGEDTLKFTLTVKDNKAISEPIFLNYKWYDESVESYDYNTHQTQIDQKKLITFTFDAKFEQQSWADAEIDLPKVDTDKLIPITYRRNYEELIGLFKTDDKGDKHKEDNYENKFIKKNSAIETIVNDFIDAVTEEDKTLADIDTLVEEKAKALWDEAVNKVQSGDLDDRPLYWARNKMQTWVKRSPVFKDQYDLDTSIVSAGSDLEKTIKLFEEKSRNYKGVDFSGAGSMKKILVTGFDPFLLNSIDHLYKDFYNILQSNPSGVVALALANDKQLGAYIQTMMVPVRYTDFDSSSNHDNGEGEGIIEEYIKPLINDVDMIITVSQALPGDYDIDVFGTLRRGGGDENMNYSRIMGSKAISTNLEWIKTTLNSGFNDIRGVDYNYTYDNIDGKLNPPAIGTIITEGSGSNYLSNEIFYRVGKMRTENRPTLETGHFHISKIQDESIGEDLKPRKIKRVLKKVKKSMKKGFKNL